MTTDGKTLLNKIEAGLNGTTKGKWYVDGSRVLADDERATIVCDACASPENPAVIADNNHIADTCPTNMRIIIDYVRYLERMVENR